MKYKRALVREVPDSYSSCISSHYLLSSVNLHKAKQQHKVYVDVLENQLGLEVIRLLKLNRHPDSCFVEDTVVIQNGRILICHMGAESRRGEEISVVEELQKYFPIKFQSKSSTLEGGDVIHLQDFLISGVTQRTSIQGTKELSTWVKQPVKIIQDLSIVHLKSYITYLGDQTLLTTNKYANHEVIKEFSKIIVPEKESYAANALVINGVVIIPRGYPTTKNMIKEMNFEVIELGINQFEYCQGALTCLSILF